MHLRQWLPPLVATAFAASIVGVARGEAAPPPPRTIMTVASKDGTPIVAECAGAGPQLVIVHGGTGDRTRWTPLFPFLVSRFRVCAMDRRSHGASGDSVPYSLQKEAEDVAAVVDSLPGEVFVLGHSYGGVCALEASFLTGRIARLILYEPPLQDRDHSAVADAMETMLREGDRELATTTFMRDIVMISPAEIAAMQARPSWPALVASIESSIRQARALSKYRFDPERMKGLNVPTLLLMGSETASPQLRQAIAGLLDSLPNRRLYVFEGQEPFSAITVSSRAAGQPSLSDCSAKLAQICLVAGKRSSDSSSVSRAASKVSFMPRPLYPTPPRRRRSSAAPVAPRPPAGAPDRARSGPATH